MNKIKILNSEFLLNVLANCIAQLVTFGGMIIYPRLLSPHDFGLYSFCYNIISIFLLFNGFGATSSILQFVSKNYNDKMLQLTYLKKSFYIGMLFNLFVTIVIFFYARYGYFSILGANKILLLMIFLPLGRLYIDILQTYFRATQQNKTFAKFTISINIVLLLINIFTTYQYGINGLVLGTYITYILVFIISFKLLNIKQIFNLDSSIISTIEFVKFSSYNVFASAFSQVLFILDIILLGYIVTNAKLIATYKIATSIPFALNFIPGIIVTYYYPIFAKLKQEQNMSMLDTIYKLQLKMLIITATISIFCIILAKPIILLIWGYNYIDALTPFIILMIGYPIIACGRIIYGMILTIYGKVRFAMWLNFYLLFINLSSTYLLIKYFGIVGASCGIILIYLISTMLSGYTVYKIIK
jgi:O-antigen/teichoic acid export membrane protein